MPKFMFEVDLSAGLRGALFQVVSGMDADNQVTEYRDHSTGDHQPIKIPGIRNTGNITMKRGVFRNDDNFRKLQDEIKAGTVNKRTITIRLLNEAGAATMHWTLEEAWPVKLVSTDPTSDSNEVAVESIEIAYANMSAASGG